MKIPATRTKNHEPSPLLSEIAYERILQALFDARLPMGSRLNQNDLTDMTGVPVGPVRDALKLLEADGIVTVHPRSGIEVIQPSTDLVRSTFQFRTIIERPAVRTFALAATQATLQEIDRQHAEAADSIASTADLTVDVSKPLGVLESAFHLPIIASLSNELVDASYRRLQLMAQIIKVRSFVFPDTAMLSIGEHRAVLQACLRRDVAAAEAAMAQHLTNALNRNLGIT